MPAQKHVAVLMGGWSAEREVSLNSGRACARALEAQGYRVTPIDVQPDIARVLPGIGAGCRLQRPARALRRGRDDPGLLELLRMPYTHSGVLASALAMQKDQAKVVMKAAGVRGRGGREN